MSSLHDSDKWPDQRGCLFSYKTKNNSSMVENISFYAQQGSLEASPCGLQSPLHQLIFPPWWSTVLFNFPSSFLSNYPDLPFYIYSLCLWRAKSFLHNRKLQHLVVFTATGSFTYFFSCTWISAFSMSFPNPGKLFSLTSEGLLEICTHTNGKRHINSLTNIFSGFFVLLDLKKETVDPLFKIHICTIVKCDFYLKYWRVYLSYAENSHSVCKNTFRVSAVCCLIL